MTLAIGLPLFFLLQDNFATAREQVRLVVNQSITAALVLVPGSFIIEATASDLSRPIWGLQLFTTICWAILAVKVYLAMFGLTNAIRVGQNAKAVYPLSYNFLRP